MDESLNSNIGTSVDDPVHQGLLCRSWWVQQDVMAGVLAGISLSFYLIGDINGKYLKYYQLLVSTLGSFDKLPGKNLALVLNLNWQLKAIRRSGIQSHGHLDPEGRLSWSWSPCRIRKGILKSSRCSTAQSTLFITTCFNLCQYIFSKRCCEPGQDQICIHHDKRGGRFLWNAATLLSWQPSRCRAWNEVGWTNMQLFDDYKNGWKGKDAECQIFYMNKHWNQGSWHSATLCHRLWRDYLRNGKLQVGQNLLKMLPTARFVGLSSPLEK